MARSAKHILTQEKIFYSSLYQNEDNAKRYRSNQVPDRKLHFIEDEHRLENTNEQMNFVSQKFIFFKF